MSNPLLLASLKMQKEHVCTLFYDSYTFAWYVQSDHQWDGGRAREVVGACPGGGQRRAPYVQVSKLRREVDANRGDIR